MFFLMFVKIIQVNVTFLLDGFDLHAHLISDEDQI